MSLSLSLSLYIYIYIYIYIYKFMKKETERDEERRDKVKITITLLGFEPGTFGLPMLGISYSLVAIYGAFCKDAAQDCMNGARSETRTLPWRFVSLAGKLLLHLRRPLVSNDPVSRSRLRWFTFKDEDVRLTCSMNAFL